MRTLLRTALSLAALATSGLLVAASPTPPTLPDNLDDEPVATEFNGQTVPPMKQPNSETITDDISHGNWLVEFYSPKCPHCVHFAPTWQTLYEFYYTSKPIASADATDGDSLNSFTRYYDFKFAKVDCLAYMDACAQYNIQSWPQVVQFKDGTEVKRMKGARDLKELSAWVEESLETIRPGSRVKGGPKLPKVGAKSVETTPETKETSKKVTEEKDSDAKSPAPIPKKTPPKPKPNYNPNGISEPLTVETFQQRVTNTLDPWFVKFYAPWCGHCQALAPNWDAMARDMRGQLNIGEVNCDVERALCKDAGVKGYPTLLFFRGGERTEYRGLRGVGDLTAYAEKAVVIGTGVPDVDLAEFEKMEEKEEVIFVYFYDHATTSEDFKALEQLTISLIGHAKLVKTNDPKMYERFKITTWPRFMVSRDGKPAYYGPLAPKDTRDAEKVLTWMKSVWLPLVPELTATNAQDVMDGKFVVLGVLDRGRSDDFTIAKREIKSAALEWIDKQEHLFQLERQELRNNKQLKIEEAEDKDDEKALNSAKNIRINMDEHKRKQVTFAWVDGVFWERWIKTTYGIDVKEDGDRVIVNDEDVSSLPSTIPTHANQSQNKRFWDITASGEPIKPSRTSILDTVTKISASPSNIPYKSTTGPFWRFLYFLRNFGFNHPFLSVLLIVSALIAGSVYGKSRARRRGLGNSDGFFHLNGKEAGLLGGNFGSGKKD